LNEQKATPLEQLLAAGGRLVEGLTRTVLGQRAAAEAITAAYVAGGHALIEGVPGIGKTLLARSLAAGLQLPFSRVQFTPDLMPADLLGTNVFDQASGSFRFVRGPIFTSVLLADEINRTPPKTQSALLEAMQEGQATIDGVPQAMSAEFFVIATQNPIEFEGTYPLPEAQLDRFVARIEMSAPDRQAELELYRRAVSGDLAAWSRPALPQALVAPAEAAALRGAAARVHVAQELLDYLANLNERVRASARVELSISPRGALALLVMARACALVSGRDFATPEDFQRFLIPCWGHRLLVSAESELEGYTARRILEEAVAAVEVPR
jgi:MoxR-like ATPase